MGEKGNKLKGTLIGQHYEYYISTTHPESLTVMKAFYYPGEPFCFVSSIYSDCIPTKEAPSSEPKLSSRQSPLSGARRYRHPSKSS